MLNSCWIQHELAYAEFIFLPDSQKNVKKARVLFEGFWKNWETDDKTCGWVVETAYSDTPFKLSVEVSMEWQWFEGGQANNKKATNKYAGFCVLEIY